MIQTLQVAYLKQDQKLRDHDNTFTTIVSHMEISENNNLADGENMMIAL